MGLTTWKEGPDGKIFQDRLFMSDFEKFMLELEEKTKYVRVIATLCAIAAIIYTAKT